MAVGKGKSKVVDSNRANKSRGKEGMKALEGE